MLKPNFIKEGDKIAIVSTARKISHAEIDEAVLLLKKWNLIPVLGKTIGIEYDQFAGEDAVRSADFQDMLNAVEIKAIWCARGGYGTVRVVDQLDFSVFKTMPKWIIGYSDITVLHSHIHNFDVATIHAQMPIDIHKGTEASRNSLKNAIFGTEMSYNIAGHLMNRTGSCSGQIVGGNLSILYSLCGSASSIDTSGKILCIEDLDEYLYHIDRMLQNIKRNGYFDKLSGLIVGGMTDMHDNNVPFGKNAKEIILDTVKEYDFPVVFDFPMGHIADNRALVFGAEVSLLVQKNMVKFTYI